MMWAGITAMFCFGAMWLMCLILIISFAIAHVEELEG